MEENVPVNEPAHLRLSLKMQNYLYEATKWGKLLAIIGFIIVAFLLVLGVFFSTVVTSLSHIGFVKQRVPLKGMGIAYVVLSIIYFFPCLFPYRFSTLARAGIKFNSQEQLSGSLSNLKSFFKFWGILTLVIVIFYLLIIGFAVWGGMNFLNSLR